MSTRAASCGSSHSSTPTTADQSTTTCAAVISPRSKAVRYRPSATTASRSSSSPAARLRLRRDRPELFTRYRPLSPTGPAPPTASPSTAAAPSPSPPDSPTACTKAAAGTTPSHAAHRARRRCHHGTPVLRRRARHRRSAAALPRRAARPGGLTDRTSVACRAPRISSSSEAFLSDDIRRAARPNPGGRWRLLQLKRSRSTFRPVTPPTPADPGTSDGSHCVARVVPMSRSPR